MPILEMTILVLVIENKRYSITKDILELPKKWETKLEKDVLMAILEIIILLSVI